MSSILDDVELYEQQKPFCLDDLVSISSFLNQLVFKLIWNSLIGNFNFYFVCVCASFLFKKILNKTFVFLTANNLGVYC